MILRYVFLFYLFLFSNNVVAQSSFFEKADSLRINRISPISIAIGASWSLSTVGFSKIWYSNYPKSNFHFFNDSKNWLQMDKMGHFYTTYKLSSISSDLYEWSGLDKKKSVFIGGVIGLGLQTTIELLDARNEEWGFSWSDMIANSLGVSSFVLQKLCWNEERIIPKFSYHSTEFANLRPTVLGSTSIERFLKDYNGQTYWFSISPGTFMQNSKFPKWLCFSLGYSVTNKLVGDKEVFLSEITNQTYYSKRQYLISLDVDFSKIKVSKPWLKVVLKQLNYLKIPFPTLMYFDGKLNSYGLYF
jgi:hypothetical protein